MPQTPGSGRVPASKAPDSIWMPVLVSSLVYALIGTAAFFLISLLVAELAGRIRRNWAMPAFLAVFAIKVFGLAFVLLNLGLPGWANRQGFVLAAAIVLVAWQVGEIRAFSKARMPIYNES